MTQFEDLNFSMKFLVQRSCNGTHYYKCQEKVFWKGRMEEEGGVCNWNKIHGRTFGLGDHVLFLDLSVGCKKITLCTFIGVCVLIWFI